MKGQSRKIEERRKRLLIDTVEAEGTKLTREGGLLGSAVGPGVRVGIGSAPVELGGFLQRCSSAQSTKRVDSCSGRVLPASFDGKTT